MWHTLRVRRPNPVEIRRLIEVQGRESLSYEPVLETLPGKEAPPGFVHRRSVKLGEGEEAWARAREALLAWEMYDQGGWLWIVGGSPPREGEDLALLAFAWGLWSLSVMRIVHLEDGENAVHLVVGTLPQHALCGEERFSVVKRGEEVWFEIFSFSYALDVLSRVALPLLRFHQRRFGTGAMEAMRKRVSLLP